MRFQPYRENEDDRATVLIACLVTVVMTPRQSGELFVLATSYLTWQNATPNMEVDWANGDGWSNGRSLG